MSLFFIAKKKKAIIYTPERCGWCGPGGGPMEEEEEGVAGLPLFSLLVKLLVLMDDDGYPLILWIRLPYQISWPRALLAQALFGGIGWV